MIAVVAANPSIDRLYEVEVMRPGEIHRPDFDHIHVVPGGKGLNVARAIKNLGGSARVFGILAGHAGRWIVEGLTAEGIEGTFVWTSGETRTSVSVVATGHGDVYSTDFYETSQPVSPETWSELERTVSRYVAEAEILCLSGRPMPGAPEDAYRRLTEIAHAARTPVAIDSRGPDFLESLSAHPELVKVNAQEAAEALDTTPATDDVLDWASKAAIALRERAGGAGICAVTCGASGMVLVDRSGATFSGRLDQVGSYPVGSGDATLAALALAFVGGLPPTRTLAAALGAGAANAETPGPGILSRERAEQLAGSFTVQA